MKSYQFNSIEDVISTIDNIIIETSKFIDFHFACFILT